jgi:hypothetical protein
MYAAVLNAYTITSTGIASNVALQQEWAEYDISVPSSTTDIENDDDRETLEDDDWRQSSTHRFLHKLARYDTACHAIVRELVSLRRSGHDLNITIVTVPVSETTSTPSDEKEYPKLDNFLDHGLGIDARTLDLKKVDKLRNKWETDWKEEFLFLHAEMQLTLFYATHPDNLPIQGYIGVSKKCCWCCDFVLK